jgi:WS/DGAT/MGAT family acyltransferase
MQKLSILDTWFTRETDTTFQHLVNVMVFEPDGPRITMKSMRSIVEQRLHVLPLTRRRLVEVPLGLGEPYWVEDPDFDLDNHLTESMLPLPGDDRQLAQYAARLGSERLDRRRPLWSLDLVNGLEGGRQALIMRFHHSSVDGGSGMDVTGRLLDPSPTIREFDEPEPWAADRVPHAPELLTRATAGMTVRPLKMLDVERRLLMRAPRIMPALAKALRELPHTAPVVGASMMRHAWKEGPPVQGPPTLAPRTPLNSLITANREVVWATFELAELKAIKEAHGVTLNDVVIAACAGSLRNWLQARDALPRIPTIVSVPVSTRTEEQQGTFGNRVSMLIGQFPTHIADPLRRLQAASASMTAAKERHEAIGPELLADLGVFMMPSLLARANRAFQRTDMPLLVWNVAVTNVPGPRHELYFAGRRLEAIKPVGFLVDDLGVMMAFIGYRDTITLGMLTCPDLVPGADELVDGVRNEIRELAALSRTSIADRGPVNGVPPAGPEPAARVAAPDRPVAAAAYPTATTQMETP